MYDFKIQFIIDRIYLLLHVQYWIRGDLMTNMKILLIFLFRRGVVILLAGIACFGCLSVTTTSNVPPATQSAATPNSLLIPSPTIPSPTITLSSLASFV